MPFEATFISAFGSYSEILLNNSILYSSLKIEELINKLMLNPHGYFDFKNELVPEHKK